MTGHYKLERIYFPLPAFALKGNWYLEQYFKQVASALCTRTNDDVNRLISEEVKHEKNRMLC
jgi:hypothetical protein